MLFRCVESPCTCTYPDSCLRVCKDGIQQTKLDVLMLNWALGHLFKTKSKLFILRKYISNLTVHEDEQFFINYIHKQAFIFQFKITDFFIVIPREKAVLFYIPPPHMNKLKKILYTTWRYFRNTTYKKKYEVRVIPFK